MPTHTLSHLFNHVDCSHNMNSMNIRDTDSLPITRLSRRILDILPAFGWSIAVEDDYDDFKNYVCRREDALNLVFTCMDVVIMLPDAIEIAVDELLIHFLMHADPSKLPENRRAFGRSLRKDNCTILQDACNDILLAAGCIITDSTVNVQYRPKPYKIRFSKEEYEQPAYTVEISYRILC